MSLPTLPSNKQLFRGAVYNNGEWEIDRVRTRMFEGTNVEILPHAAAFGDTLHFVCPSRYEYAFISPPVGEEFDIPYAEVELDAGRYKLLKGEAVRMVRTGTAAKQQWTVCLGSGVRAYTNLKIQEASNTLQSSIDSTKTGLEATIDSTKTDLEAIISSAASEADSYHSLVLRDRRMTGSINFFRHSGTIYVEFKDVAWGGYSDPLLAQNISDQPLLFPRLIDSTNPQNSKAEFYLSDNRGRQIPVEIFHDGRIAIHYRDDSNRGDVVNGSAYYLGPGNLQDTLVRKVLEKLDLVERGLDYLQSRG